MRQGHQISRIVLVVAVVGWCYVALAQEVLGNFRLGTDFSKYHTYKWFTIEGNAYPNQTVDAQIKQSVDSQLASKGLTKTDNDKADLYIGYQIAVDQVKQWMGYDMGDGLRCSGMPAARSLTIGVGTLILDNEYPRLNNLFRETFQNSGANSGALLSWPAVTPKTGPFFEGRTNSTS